MPSVPYDDDAPLLADLMPWSVAPPRPGRAWPTAPDPACLRARWDALLKAEPPDREALFEPSRARTLHSAVGQLPGRPTGTERLARAAGPCAEPVRVLAAPFDEQWLIPDHRLLDVARPELWRVADERQVFLVETPDEHHPLLATALLPTLRTGRVRPLHRRPAAAEPNLAPGLLDHLSARLGVEVTPLDLAAWFLATGRPDHTVPLTDDARLWSSGVSSGHRLLWLLRRDGDRPRLPGGRRPYVRAPLPPRPATLRYDPEEEALHLDEGRVSPVPAGAWDYELDGVRVLESWFAARTAPGAPGTLEAIRPAAWLQSWTSELLELITVLALLAEARSRTARLEVTSSITATDLVRSAVLPPPRPSRLPASVLDHPEEGPEGQFALL
ncbi:type ISP restriction/modification enzyme [Streptomyces malaysiense]|uniref:DNA methyltransferase n=1 Tax=Streptomyces malaysiense TaxID=1428626 RepID=A0A1J4PWP3_9ACTN|nr:type ISP restriction/modification enzyme [Streptomyces malaysiense]OIK25357.1 DNA methyltransferase [Streptomyces malaysiense]